jgi:hypothetical protein
MGVINFYFVDNEVEDCCRWKVVHYAFNFSSSLSIIIGCTTSAPDGSSPRGYSQKNSGIGSKYTYCRLSLFSCDTLGTIMLRCSSRSSGDSSPRVHEGVRCALLYTPIFFVHIALYPYNFACVFSLSFIYCCCLISYSGQNLKACRFIWACNLLRPMKGCL